MSITMSMNILIDYISKVEKLEDLDIIFNIELTGNVYEFEEKLPYLYCRVYVICKKYKLNVENKYTNYCQHLCAKHCLSGFAYQDLYKWLKSSEEKDDTDRCSVLRTIIDIKNTKNVNRNMSEILETTNISHFLFRIL